MNLFSLSGLLIGTTSSVLIVILLRHGKVELQKVWMLFNISIAIWGFGGFFAGTATNQNLALIFWKIAHIGVIFIPICFYHVVCVFSEAKRKTLLVVTYILGFTFLYLDLYTSWFIPKVEYLFNSIYYARNQGIIYYVFFIFWVSLVILGHVHLFLYFKKASTLQRNKILYFFLGVFSGFIGGIMNFFPILGLDIYPYGNFTIPFYCIIVTYAIIKYRLMDVFVVISRVSIFIVSYTIVLGIPFALAFGCQQKLCDVFGQNWWMVPLIISTVLATVGPFVYIFIDRKVEVRLLKEQKNYQNILRNASKGMIRIKNLKHLLNLIVHVVTKAVKIKNISIYLFDGENSQYTLQAERGLKIDLKEARSINSDSSLISYFKSKNDSIVTEEAAMKLREDEQNIDLKDLVSQLNSLNAALAVPCFLEERLIGILILGEKRSKKLYSEDDLTIFSVLANQAALAIENAQFYDEIQRTNEQLIQAEKLATIGTMADGLSHQINNRFHALSLISGDSLDVLQTFDFSGCSEKIKEVISDVKVALEKIQNNVLQGGEVVKGLLKYSRPDEGGFEPVCLIEVISGAIEMVQYKIKLKEINLVQNIPIDLPKLLGSRIQLQEVFFNLIDNAYDAIKERQIVLKEYGYHGKIEISAVCLDGHVEIVIADNGIGVKEQDRKKLFAPFFTTKASSRKGTGLGLYVIEKIVTAHQGKLSVDSNYGVGTHFVMLLPTAKG